MSGGPTSNLVADGRFIIPNKASLLAVTSDVEEPSVFCLNFASVVQKNTYSAGVLGHYFHFGQGATVSSGEPLLAKFKELDAVIFATKLSNAGVTYLYGITVEKLIEFMKSPPAATAVVDEMKLLQSWKLPNENLESLSKLENSETHKLIDYADKLISHMPLFKRLGIRNHTHAKAWAEKAFEPTVKKVLVQMEAAERTTAKERGHRAADAGDSAAGGAKAKERWALVQQALLTVNKFYDDPLIDRIIAVPIDETTGKPTADGVAKVKADLGCARHTHMLARDAHCLLLEYIHRARIYC